LLTFLFKHASFSPLPNLQRVFHLWKSIDLNSTWVDIFDDVNLLAWVQDSHPFIFFSLACFRVFRDAPHSRFWCRDLKLCLLDFLKMLHLALS